MKQQIARILDALVPQHIKELEQIEELERSRILVAILLIHLMAAIAGLIGSLLIFDLAPASTLNSKIPLAMMIGISGYALSLGVFRQTGRHMISGNIYALTYYAAIFVGVLTVSGQELIAVLLYLLALPLLVTFIANYLSGIVWVVIVALTPILLSLFYNTNLGQFFLGNWVTFCLVLFVAIYISHIYLNRLSQRLNTQCSWFEFAASHDSLTGLANRAVFEMRLKESIELCQLHGTKSVLVYIDLDKFKPINDSYGHQAGDIVLSTVADRLRHLVRRTDTVARLGGDEFAILFDQCSPEYIKPLIDRMATIVSDPIDAFGNRLHVGCSIGVVVCPDDGLLADQLANKADERMYEAKRKNDANWTPVVISVNNT